MGVPVYLEKVPGGTRISVYVQPRAKKEGVAGIHDGSLKLKVRAPAIGGRANRAVIALLASALGLPERECALVAGEKSRSKRVDVAGLEPGEVEERLAHHA